VLFSACHHLLILFVPRFFYDSNHNDCRSACACCARCCLRLSLLAPSSPCLLQKNCGTPYGMAENSPAHLHLSLSVSYMELSLAFLFLPGRECGRVGTRILFAMMACVREEKGRRQCCLPVMPILILSALAGTQRLAQHMGVTFTISATRHPVQTALSAQAAASVIQPENAANGDRNKRRRSDLWT